MCFQMKMTNEELRDSIALLPAGDEYDNIGMALITYFETRPNCPKDDVEPSVGRSKWALKQANKTLDRLVEHLKCVIEGEKMRT
jgi:hypothetical protein